jgi:hypothetical protein
MKLTVLTWLTDELVPFIGRLIELTFRIILFLLPLGIYLYLIQSRSKASKVSNLSIYTNDDSVWQHIFPGFILVSINPQSFKRSIASTKNNIQLWISSNKYILSFLFMAAIVFLMVLNEVKR